MSKSIMGNQQSYDPKEFHKHIVYQKKSVGAISGVIVYNEAQLKDILHSGNCLKQKEITKIITTVFSYPVTVQNVLTLEPSAPKGASKLGLKALEKHSRENDAEFSLVLFRTNAGCDYSMYYNIDFIASELIRNDEVVVLKFDWK